jgi:outer membrane protein assembly factor BamB
MARREVLAAAGAATMSSVAGCSALRSGPETQPVRDGDWLAYGNGPTNDNHVEGGAPSPDEHAVLTSAPWPYAPPVVHDGLVYFASGRQVTALTVGGTERWSSRLDVAVSGAPAVDPDRGRLYVPTRVVPTADGPDPAPASVTGISLADGEIIGAPRVGDDRTYGVTIDDGDVYARSATACVRLAPDGAERWRTSLDPLVYDGYNLGDSTATQIAPAVTQGGVYVPDRDALVKLDPATGEERWRVSVDTPYAASVVNPGLGVVQTGWQETVAVEPSGDVRWRRNLHSRAAATTTGADVYVVAGDLHELHGPTGETNWQTHLPSEGTAAPVVTDECVLAASGDLRAFHRDAEGLFAPDRVRWHTSSIHAATFSSPVVSAGRVFVVGPHGLLALRPREDR